MIHRKLTDRQRLFAREYLVDLNATRAAIRAGYSRRSASQRGWALRRHPGIAARIDAALEDRARLDGITPERVLYELALMGFYNIRDYLVEGGEGGAGAVGADGAIWVDPARLTRAQAAAITELQIVSGPGAGPMAGKVRINLADKSRNLELIGRHLGLFPRASGGGKAVAGADAGKDAAKDARPVRKLSDTELAQRILAILARGGKPAAARGAVQAGAGCPGGSRPAGA